MQFDIACGLAVSHGHGVDHDAVLPGKSGRGGELLAIGDDAIGEVDERGRWRTTQRRQCLPERVAQTGLISRGFDF